MLFEGKIKKLLPVIDGEHNGTVNAKRLIILESNPDEQSYTDEFLVEMYKSGDATKYVKENFDFIEGNLVKCVIGGRVNEWKGKNYGNLNIFKLEMLDNTKPEPKGDAVPF